MATTVKTLRNFIGGDWVEGTGDEAREIVSPVTGERLAEAPNALDMTDLRTVVLDVGGLD